MARSAERKIAFLFLVVLLALAGLRFYSHYNTLKMIENGRWAAHAQKIETELEAMLSALDEARAARRDYLATRDARRAADFEDARRRTTEGAARLRQEAENHPEQRERVQRLEGLVKAEMDALERATLPTAAADEEPLARVRAAAAEIEAEEGEVLGGYLATAQARARREFWVSAASTGAAVCLLVFGYWLLVRHFAQRRRARAEIGRLNEDLRRKVDELETMFNVIPVGVVVADDPECRSMRGNAVMARMLGVPPGLNLSKSAPEGERPAYRTFAGGRELKPEELPMQAAAATGAAFDNVEFELVVGERTIELCGNVVPLRDGQGRPRGAVGAFWDCADFRAREERLIDERDAAEAAAAAQEDALATVSHDLRTPLGATKLLATSLKRGPLEFDELTTVADQILRMCDAQARLVDDVLDLTRITHGKLAIEKRPIRIADVVRAACDTVRLVGEAGGVHLRLAVADEDVRVLGDSARLQQVLWNLLSNALKFTPRGGRVDVSVRGDDGAVEVRVADTGRGIDPQRLPHIFDRFWKGPSASDMPGCGGLGLGLAIVKHLVELHDGTITAESDGDGRGTAFTLRLPRAQGGGNGQAEVVSLGAGGDPTEGANAVDVEQTPGKDAAAGGTAATAG